MWPGFSLSVVVGIARGRSPRKQWLSRYVSFAAHVKTCACWEEFFLDGKTWPGFLFPVLVDIARVGSPRKQWFSRHVSFAAHAKSCACWGRFFLNGEIWPGFLPSVLVDVDNLGSTVYSIAWLSVPRPTSWGGCYGGVTNYPGGKQAFHKIEAEGLRPYCCSHSFRCMSRSRLCVLY